MSQGLFQEDPMLSIREAFRHGDPIDESKVRPFILESWKRCRTLNADGPSASRHVAPEVLKEALIKNSELLASSVPIMENLLTSVSAVHSVIGLADSEGLILHIAGAKEDISALEVFQTGWYATEDTSGTNGIGTGLIERRPLAILGAEHFYGDALGWCCTSAPIMNEGNFAGVLNITIKTDSYHQHTLSLVQAAAYAISEQLKLRLLFKEQTAMLESMTEGIIILDASLRIRTANKRARTMLGIDGDFAGRMLSDYVSNLDSYAADLSSSRRLRLREVTFALGTGSFSCALSTAPVEGGGVILTLQSLKQMREYATHLMAPGAAYRFEDIVGNSTAIREIIRVARLASNSDIATLILGESGTGKELFAQSIHNASTRAGGPFVAVNCGALPRSLLESELFGYSEGAFTGARRQGRPGKFELADGGTIFLDEIGELPLEAQTALLRILQENEVVRIGGSTPRHIDIRVIAATNVDLESAVAQGAFRKDLFYRLNVLTITVPPLRNRRTDIRLISNALLAKYAAPLGKSGAEFTEEALEALTYYEWPGNVRELENVIERTVNLCPRPLIDVGDLPAAITAYSGQEADEPPLYARSSGLLKAKGLELIIESLQESGGNLRLTASNLGISRCTLYRRLREAGLSPDMWRHRD